MCKSIPSSRGRAEFLIYEIKKVDGDSETLLLLHHIQRPLTSLCHVPRWTRIDSDRFMCDGTNHQLTKRPVLCQGLAELLSSFPPFPFRKRGHKWPVRGCVSVWNGTCTSGEKAPTVKRKRKRVSKNKSENATLHLSIAGADNNVDLLRTCVVAGKQFDDTATGLISLNFETIPQHAP
jgi:hypothetical protein